MLARVAASIVMAATFVAALMFSVVLFAVVITLGLGVAVWFWWRTRELRKVMREQVRREQDAASAAGSVRDAVVIEGEVIRDEADPKRLTE